MLHTVSTPPDGMIGKLLDLGKGRLEDYEGIGDAARDRIVMVEHEYPFSPTHVHRREKIRLAIRHGASALLMSNPTGEGGLLSGSSATHEGFDSIPCGYITHECATRLRTRSGDPQTIRMLIDGTEEKVKSGNPSLIIGNPTRPRIVLSAHIDGHPLGESALDNASGVAVAIAVARRLAPLFGPSSDYALQTIIFTAEEWGLLGSEQYLEQLSDGERSTMKLNINLDTVGGSPNFTALISGFPQLAPLIRQAADAVRLDVSTYLPLLANSDHHNFARAGIPAFRLVAGFNEPMSRVQHILSGSDTRDKVAMTELKGAFEFVCAVIKTAIQQPSTIHNLK